MRLIITIIIGSFLITDSFGQNVLMYGYVKDSTSGDYLPGAHFIYDNHVIAVSNSYGYYSVKLPTENYLKVKMLGYTERAINITSYSDSVFLNIDLIPSIIQLNDIEISDKKEQTISTNKVGAISIDPLRINSFPILGGESDILKFMHSLPGISQGKEGTSGLHVRGGSPDQNLILVDGVPIYNINHLFGFLSVFNTDAVKKIDIYKDGIPATYTGRLSSVVDVYLKEGNFKEDRKVINISPIASSILYETPLKKDKSSLLVTGRRTWLDLFTNVLNNEDQRVNFNFYDLSFKYANKLNKKNNLYISYYRSKDKFRNKIVGLQDVFFSFDWQNHTLITRWNKILGENKFLNTSASVSNYSFNQVDQYKNEDTNQKREVNSSILDFNLKSQIDIFLQNNHSISLGVDYSLLYFKPEIKQYGVFSNIDHSGEYLNNFNFFYQGLYSNIFQDTDLHYGFRYSLIYSDKFFNYLQPRLSIVHDFSPSLNLRLSYDRIVQNVHLLTNTTLGQPTDLWVTANKDVPPELSDQLSLTLLTEFPKKLNISVAGYYKKLYNVIEYKEGANFLFGAKNDWIDRVTTGNGSSYGIELLVQKQFDKIESWISYTWSKSDRRFSDINNGDVFPYKYDRRHDLTTNFLYRFNKKNSLSLSFNYNTGNAITLPSAFIQTSLPPCGQYYNADFSDIRNTEFIEYRNNQRMPAYHRLDLSYRNHRENKNSSRTWIIGVYNAYNNLNPYFIYEYDGTFRQLILFPILPSIAYRLEF